MKYVVKKCDINNPYGVIVLSNESKDECLKGAVLLAVMEIVGVSSGEVWRKEDNYVIAWKGNYAETVVFNIEPDDIN